MAVQQNKKSPSKRGMHRAHDFLTAPAARGRAGHAARRICATTSAPTGYYRGKKVVKTKADE